jgi:hypothetical protein
LKADVDPRNEGEIKKKIEGIESENEELGYSRAQRIRESNHGEPLRIEEYSTVDEESDIMASKRIKEGW